MHTIGFMTLLICRSCARHVRGGTRCPFCSSDEQDLAPISKSRATRSALAFGAVALAAAGVACVSEAPAYGGPEFYGVEPADAEAVPDARADGGAADSSVDGRSD